VTEMIKRKRPADSDQ